MHTSTSPGEISGNDSPVGTSANVKCAPTPNTRIHVHVWTCDTLYIGRVDTQEQHTNKISSILYTPETAAY